MPTDDARMQSPRRLDPHFFSASRTDAPPPRPHEPPRRGIRQRRGGCSSSHASRGFAASYCEALCHRFMESCRMLRSAPETACRALSSREAVVSLPVAFISKPSLGWHAQRQYAQLGDVPTATVHRHPQVESSHPTLVVWSNVHWRVGWQDRVCRQRQKVTYHILLTPNAARVSILSTLLHVSQGGDSIHRLAS